MTKVKKINYCLLLVVFSLLSITPVQSQTPTAEITLTWSTNTCVPLDYPGKALPTGKSAIEVIAILDWTTGQKQINSQELIYNWFLNDSIQKEASGRGKDFFRFNLKESSTKRYAVQLEVKNKQEDLIAASSYLYLRPVQPEIIIQSENSNYQVSANQQKEFIAQPYFFNIQSPDELNYSWSLDGETAEQAGQSHPNMLTLEIGQVAQSVKQNLAVWAENKNRPLEKAQAEVEINFIP